MAASSLQLLMMDDQVQGNKIDKFVFRVASGGSNFNAITIQNWHGSNMSSKFNTEPKRIGNQKLPSEIMIYVSNLLLGLLILEEMGLSVRN